METKGEAIDYDIQDNSTCHYRIAPDLRLCADGNGTQGR